MLKKEDICRIEAIGSSLKTVEKQIEHFKKGFPWMKIIAPATPERGIFVLDGDEADAACKYYDKASIHGKCKFVPASGAASRMFKDIYAGLAKLENGEDVSQNDAVAELARRIEDFAFYSDTVFGLPDDSMEYRRFVASKLLGEEGLGYGSKPKGVLAFHRYSDGEIRTAFAEHLVEAQLYMRNHDDTANLVVTISPEHRQLFEEAFAAVKDKFEKRYNIKYNVSFTYQDKATDTIAVDEENKPFRKDDGSLLFRPAGHGALIYNLNKVDDELISIKNIDNVANERLLPVTAKYKKVLLGKCLELRDRIFGFLQALDNQTSEDSEECQALCDRIESFMDKILCVQLPSMPDNKSRVKLLRSKLSRPIRVCGMVRNQGEPGGGPFIIRGKDGSSNLQILESVQLNMADPESKAFLARASHFNPVDLVCCVRDYKGNKFDLLRYVDEDAGFISSKSYQGRALKALELPGLWNGAMSDWNTLFIEVPLETFNPVKVVLDLLRPAHQ
ncbi:MAG: DUF4301 family protein [Candidatus Cryptobacteroides sp.]